MKKVDLIIGFFIGIAASLLGTFLFILLFTEYGFAEGIRILKSQGSFGKLVTLGAVLNLIAFFVLLKFQKELMARGVILATILLTLFTLFV